MKTISILWCLSKKKKKKSVSRVKTIQTGIFRNTQMKLQVCDARPEFLARGGFFPRRVGACWEGKKQPWSSSLSTYLHELPHEPHTVTWTRGGKKKTNTWAFLSLTSTLTLTPGAEVGLPLYLCGWGSQRRSHHPLPGVSQRATVWRCRPSPARTDRLATHTSKTHWTLWFLGSPGGPVQTDSNYLGQRKGLLEVGGQPGQQGVRGSS